MRFQLLPTYVRILCFCLATGWCCDLGGRTEIETSKNARVARDHRRETRLKPFVACERTNGLELKQTLSYSHDVTGRLLPGTAGELRNVFRTSTGRILAVTLSPDVHNSGKYRLRLTLRGENGENDAAEIGLEDRHPQNWCVLEPARLFWSPIPNWEASPQNPGYAKPQDFGLQMHIRETTNGAQVRVVAWIPGLGRPRREVGIIGLRALYEWHAERLLAPATPRFDIGEKTFAAETIEGGAGCALYDLQELESNPMRPAATYAVLRNAWGRRIADRIPIAYSGYEFVWKQTDERWGIEKSPEPVHREDSLTEVFERCRPALVQIMFSGRTNTGFIANSLGEILTCEGHLLDEKDLEHSVTVRFAGGATRRGRAIGDTESYDLTKIRLAEPMPRLATTGPSHRDLVAGQHCLIVGFPNGGSECRYFETSIAALDEARVSAKNREVRFTKVESWEDFGPGAVVLNESGRLIGITCAELVKGTPRGKWVSEAAVAVPLHVLRDFIGN